MRLVGLELDIQHQQPKTKSACESPEGFLASYVKLLQKIDHLGERKRASQSKFFLTL